MKFLYFLFLSFFIFTQNTVTQKNSNQKLISYKIGFEIEKNLTKNKVTFSYAKKYSWIPIKLDIVNTHSHIKGDVKISTDEMEEKFTSITPFVSPAPSRKRFFSYMPIERSASSLFINLHKNNEVEFIDVTNSPFMLRNGQKQILLLTENKKRNTIANILKREKVSSYFSPKKYEIITISPDDLPDQWIGLQSIDIIMFDQFLFSNFNNKQWDLIYSYVKNGGHLVLCAGSSFEYSENRNLKKLLPLKIHDIHKVVAKYRNQSLDVMTGKVFSHSNVVMYANKIFINAKEKNIPLVINRSFGCGMVTYFGSSFYDSFWQKRPKYQKKMIKFLFNQQKKTIMSDMLTLSSINKTSTAKELFHVLSIPTLSRSNLLFIFCLYLLLLVPLNYIFCKKLASPEYAWTLVPFIAFVFGCIIFFMGHMKKEHDVEGKVASVLYTKANSGVAQAQHYYSLFSFITKNYAFSVGDKNHFVRDFQHGGNKPLKVSFSERMDVDSCHFKARSARVLKAEGVVSINNGIQQKKFAKIKNGKIVTKITNNTDIDFFESYIIYNGISKIGNFSLGKTLNIDCDIKKKTQESMQKYIGIQFFFKSNFFKNKLNSGKLFFMGMYKNVSAPIFDKNNIEIPLEGFGVFLCHLDIHNE